jgi:hypothetical protein
MVVIKMSEAELERVELEARAGTTIFASTGMLGTGHADRMSTLHFYKAVKGSKVILLDTNYYFNIATYSLTFDEKYIYTYEYQKEQSWTTYNNDLSGTTYRQDDYIFEDEVYFRVCLKRKDGSDFDNEEAVKINDILMFLSRKTDEYQEKPWFTEEIQKTADTILRKRTEKSLVLGLVSDTHITVNGTWEDTSNNIKALHQKVGFDGIVHLGDLTDGMVPANVTKKYAQMVMDDLKANKIPLYVVLGNHDSNYFYNNPEPLSDEEQYDIYQRHSDDRVNRKLKKTFYYVDYESVSLRCLFLSSFDYREEVRYGFSEEELVWVQECLENIPTGYSVLVFSHVPPLPKLDYEWCKSIRNGDRLLSILEIYSQQNGIKILAYVHGHTHADFVYSKRSFPIISIGCSKCEYFKDKKPIGSITHERKLNTVTQELWDTLVVTPSENRIDFIRFGAGEDRTIRC